MIDASDLNLAVDAAVKNLRRSVRNIRKYYAPNTPIYPQSLIDHPVVHLNEDLLNNARVFSSRESMISKLPFSKSGICVEVGTSTGAFARQILLKLQPSCLHLYDIDVSRLSKDIVNNNNVVVHHGKSEVLLNELDDDSIDFAYVDADHSYSSVKREIDILLRKVKEGGHIMFNDYTRWSITEIESYGVLSAFNEFINENGFPLVGVALSGTGHFDVATQVTKKR